ncbi:MAG: hypothetical protein H6595_07045 [Flavobacteriales bacterium]|nr:hypothetical protein [Flavobacteriales bacterium]MCB9167222.1 hypothetical protein [Flavobacteriales bacterium]
MPTRMIRWVCLIALSMSGLNATAVWNEFKYIDVYLAADDHQYMEMLQERAISWAKRTGATLYNGFRKPLRQEEVQFRDDLTTIPSDSWRINLIVSRSLDTLSVLSFSRNIHYRSIAQQSLYGNQTGDVYCTEPLYSLPLTEYYNFLDRDEINKLFELITKYIDNISNFTNYTFDPPISSFRCSWHDNPHQHLLDSDNLRGIAYWCQNDQPPHWYRTPQLVDRIGPSEMSGLINNIDTLISQDGSKSTIDRILDVNTIDLVIEIVPTILRSKLSYVHGDLLSFIVRFDSIGIVFGDNPGREIFCVKDEFINCYGDPNILGWLNATFANDVEDRLME